MSEGIQNLLGRAGEFSIAALICSGIFVLFLRIYFPSYLSEKGKNLATREDIGEITGEIESVRSQFAAKLQELSHQNSLVIEAIRSRDQLRLVAGERRLQAHQEAFALWWDLAWSLDDDLSQVQKCQNWWKSNCLYLTEEASEAFRLAYMAAPLYRSFWRSQKETTPAIEKVYERITNAGDVIQRGVGLPALREEVRDELIEKLRIGPSTDN